MTPQAFIAKWRDNPLTEKAGAQAHFEDLCALLGMEPPRIEGEYQYECGLIKKSSASQGWADVWKRGCFAWEYKAPDKDLGAALKQLMVYALALDNPPLLVVSDRKRIEIHTHFTGTRSEVHEILLENIGQPENLQKLRWLFESPERFKPSTPTYAVTEEAARSPKECRELLGLGESQSAQVEISRYLKTWTTGQMPFSKQRGMVPADAISLRTRHLSKSLIKPTMSEL